MTRDKPNIKIRRRKVTFSVEAHSATEVILMGDFNNWNPQKHPMKRDATGLWQKAVIIPPGRYEYKFLVDGRWKEDPHNDQRCRNLYGTYNNVLNVSEK